MNRRLTLTASLIYAVAFAHHTVLHADNNLLEDDFLLHDDSTPLIANKQTQASWQDYFVTTLSHEQTRNDEGDTRFLRYSARVEYEQAFAKGWFGRVDVKGSSYRSLDQQAQQRGETYEKATLKAAWLQYSQGACVHKAGQQTLMWGEVTGTFTVDDITPFDFTEQLLTDYANIRLAVPMWQSNCYLDNKKEVQVFYIPNAKLHRMSHLNDEYSLKLATNVDDEDLDAEFGARFKFVMGKTEFALMAADLISNFPTVVLVPAPSVAPPGTPPMQIPVLSEYELYGLSFSHSSGAWQFNGDVAFKTDQLVEGSFAQSSDVIAAAFGFEYLTKSNHNLSAGIWGEYALDNDFTANQNESTPFLTVSWRKTYLNDNLNLSLLANGREKPRSSSTTAQASYQLNDYWNIAGALTVADQKTGTVNPLLSDDNEATLIVKYQF